MNNYQLKTGFENMDIDWVVNNLQTTYWADDRSKETIIKSMENSCCFGVFDGEHQIGFCRIITDFATTYYFCDAIVEENYRGKGIGSILLNYITQHDLYKNLRGILGTKDAHGFYEHFGFKKNDKLFMQRWSKIL